jgi:hypothetical protein
MSSHFKNEDIAIYSGVSVRTIRRILRYFKMFGTVEGSRQGPQHGPRRHLRDIDVEVNVARFYHFTLIEHLFRFYLELFDKRLTCIWTNCVTPLQVRAESKSLMPLFGELFVGLVSQ